MFLFPTYIQIKPEFLFSFVPIVHVDFRIEFGYFHPNCFEYRSNPIYLFPQSAYYSTGLKVHHSLSSGTMQIPRPVNDHGEHEVPRCLSKLGNKALSFRQFQLYSQPPSPARPSGSSAPGRRNRIHPIFANPITFQYIMSEFSENSGARYFVIWMIWRSLRLEESEDRCCEDLVSLANFAVLCDEETINSLGAFEIDRLQEVG